MSTQPRPRGAHPVRPRPSGTHPDSAGPRLLCGALLAVLLTCVAARLAAQQPRQQGNAAPPAPQQASNAAPGAEPASAPASTPPASKAAAPPPEGIVIAAPGAQTAPAAEPAAPAAPQASAPAAPQTSSSSSSGSSSKEGIVLTASPLGKNNGATYVGAEVCAQCHYDRFVSYQHSVHAIGGDPRTPAGRFGCESCHGPASKHVAGGGGRGVGGLMTFNAALPAAVKNEPCLTCHTRGATSLWHGSVHETRNLACVTCHDPHGGNAKLLVAKSQQQLCTQCHQQIRSALMKPSHHPLREEKMQCTNCHNPHGSQTVKLIAANSVNDKCYECHAEKRGPFLFEHPPVRENCLNCHDPHGSSHEPLLVAKKPLLCQRCHSNALHPGTLYAAPTSGTGAGAAAYQIAPQLMYRACTNCHVNIHGSNSPSGKFWHR